MSPAEPLCHISATPMHRWIAPHFAASVESVAERANEFVHVLPLPCTRD